MNSRSFGVIILSAMPPADVARIARRIHSEVPEARVCGVLYERRPPKSFSKRIQSWIRSFRDASYPAYVASRLYNAAARAVGKIGTGLLRFAHASPARPNGPSGFSLTDLAELCNSTGAELFVTRDMHLPESLEFVRRVSPDLGIVYGTRVLKPELFDIPRNGSVNIHKRKVPDYRGGGPVGLWELLDNQTEIGITVHRVAAQLDAGAVVNDTTIPIEPYDNLTSLALKADMVGNDLLVKTVADFARGSVHEKPQAGEGRMFRNPKAHDLRRLQKELASSRLVYRRVRRRSSLKLAVKTLVLAPYVILRNWYRRLYGGFPVVILYHHLVTDRPHRMGIPTERFFDQVNFLKKYYKIVSLSEAIELLKTGKTKCPAVALTFDDGYAENFVNLRAVSEKTGIPVGFFVSTQKVEEQAEFDHDVKLGERGFLPMTWEQVRYLAARGYVIGSHTRSHFNCRSSDAEKLQWEIMGSKQDLDAHLGQPTTFFSFPWGHPADISPQALQLSRTTYPYVASACGGENFPANGTKPWLLNRCTHTNDFWELEMQLQAILNLRPEVVNQ